MTRGRKPNIYIDDNFFDEDDILHSRKVGCTCDEDPDWCEKCNVWG